MCDTPGCNCSSHGQNAHHHKLISDIHSCAANEFCGAAIPVPDSTDTAQKRSALFQNPSSARALTELGDALAYQMRYREAIKMYEKAYALHPDNFDIRRKLAARYLSTLRIDEAQELFYWCNERNEDKLDGAYRIALCSYYKGDYVQAITLLEHCYPLCVDNDEMFIAILYWELICRVKLRYDISPTLERYSDELKCGHHVGYMLTLKLFLLNDTDTIFEAEGHGELAMSIYLYGLYHYYLFLDKHEKAHSILDLTLKYDTYFSSFAYLGAFLDKERQNKAISLKKWLSSKRKIALAFSGGVDSVYLAYAAKESGANIMAYLIKTAFQPNFEIEDAKRAAKDIGIDLTIIDADVLSDESIISNPQNRCYYCKKCIMDTLKKHAIKNGYTSLVDGTNFSDGKFDRPGVKALKEYGVRSPLAECGLTKQEIRQLSREAELFTADKPSYSCLATRIATGEKVTSDTLEKIEKAENILFSLGYSDFRIRVSKNSATLEINAAQKEKINNEFDGICRKFRPLFDKITLAHKWR